MKNKSYYKMKSMPKKIIAWRKKKNVCIRTKSEIIFGFQFRLLFESDKINLSK